MHCQAPALVLVEGTQLHPEGRRSLSLSPLVMPHQPENGGPIDKSAHISVNAQLASCRSTVTIIRTL
ncbi:hypothetical protein EON64_13180 [archaeon]|nr:MAG: hypothetical protein EON64_13180 [archaeon]